MDVKIVFFNVETIWCWYIVPPGDISSVVVESYIELGSLFPNILQLTF